MPDCVKSGELTIPISWDVEADRMYKYEVRGGSLLFSKFKLHACQHNIPCAYCGKLGHITYNVTKFVVTLAATVSGGQSSGDFVVSGGRGTLTLKAPGEWDVAIYKVTVTDLSSSIPSMTTGSFKVRKGRG